MSAVTGARTKTPLARHILNRLHQHGCWHLHGVPGDYTLPFLSHLSDSKVRWIGTGNELGAGYAADGYARITGLGAVCTTFGVGELSAINAIAGSFAERVSVMHIVGTPSTKIQNRWIDSKLGATEHDTLVHHALGRRRSLRTFAQMAERVVTKVVHLGDATDKAAAFDRSLQLCLMRKMPVYVELPSDLAGLPVDADTELLPFEDTAYGLAISEEEQKRLTHDLFNQIRGKKRPVIVVDGLASRFGLSEAINRLIAATNIPTVVTPHGLGIVSSRHPSYYGVYTGKLGNAELHEYIQSSDCVLVFGELFSDTNTVGWSAMPPMSDSSVTTLFTDKQVDTHGEQYLTNVSELLESLTSLLRRETLNTERTNEQEDRKNYAKEDGAEEGTSISEDTAATEAETTPRNFLDLSPQSVLTQPLEALTDPSLSQPMTQDYVYPRLSSWLKDNDTLILANGTPLIGAKLLALPPNIRVIASGLWFSIGQMLPTAEGVALAHLRKNQPGRTILLEGDGSFQTTCQELSTMIRYQVDATILLLNNKGYAYERLIQGPSEEYNDINDWDYTLAPLMMGGRKYVDGAHPDAKYKIYTRKISTTLELDEVLADPEFNTKRGLKLIELQMQGLDVPEYFRPALEAAGQRLAQVAEDSDGAQATTKRKVKLVPKTTKEGIPLATSKKVEASLGI